MRRLSPILLVVLALLTATAGLVLATSPVQADAPQSIVLPVFGRQEYRHVEDARFYRLLQDQNLPAGVSFAGVLKCTALQDGTPIDNNLPGGRYNIDPSTCSGLVLTGPNAADYQIQYTLGGDYFVYPGSIDVPQNVSATGTVTSLFMAKTTYSGRLRDYWTKQPIVGLPVTIVSQLTILPILNGPKCTSVTDANGRYSCSTLPLSWGLIGMPYLVTTPNTPNYGGIAQPEAQPQS